jgi:hypothetical protein
MQKRPGQNSVSLHDKSPEENLFMTKVLKKLGIDETTST